MKKERYKPTDRNITREKFKEKYREVRSQYSIKNLMRFAGYDNSGLDQKFGRIFDEKGSGELLPWEYAVTLRDYRYDHIYFWSTIKSKIKCLPVSSADWKTRKP